jgi:predicted transcriptional regulator
MPEATPENIDELCTEYVKSLVEIIIILQKIQEKVCNICPKRKGCKMKEETKKSRDKLMQTKDLPKLTALVGAFVDHIAEEIFLNAMVVV